MADSHSHTYPEIAIKTLAGKTLAGKALNLTEQSYLELYLTEHSLSMNAAPDGTQFLALP